MAAHDDGPVSRVETVARMLAAGSGCGSFLSASVSQVGQVTAETRGEVVGIAWRGTREESAARSIDGSTRARAMHAWTRAAGTAALPSYRPDPDVVAAMAGVEAVPCALLKVFALEDWQAWPMVETAALVVITGKGSREAVCDAMGRILWRVAAVPQDERARQLHMRAADYRALTRRAEAVLREWLDRAAGQLQDRLRQIKQARKFYGLSDKRPTRCDPCGLRTETWWHPERDGFTPARRHR